jgi:hypothetical protein
VRRSVLPCLILVLLGTVTPLPALAGERSPGRPVAEASGVIASLWEAIMSRVVPSRWLEKLGPTMDPNGLSASSCPPVECEVNPGNGTDLGPGMDPDG